MIYKNTYKEAVALIKFYIGGLASLEVWLACELEKMYYFLPKAGVTRRNAGFTLIETLLAVLVMTVAIVGPLTIASKSLSTALVAKNRTIALYLAQDAVEYVRFARDTNRLGNTNWLIGNGSASLVNLDPCVSTDGAKTCYFDSTGQNPSVITQCTSNSCTELYFNSTVGRYTYDTSTTKTIFVRTVSITTPPPGTSVNTSDAVVTVVVSWKDAGNFLRSVTLVYNLLDWQ